MIWLLIAILKFCFLCLQNCLSGTLKILLNSSLFLIFHTEVSQPPTITQQSPKDYIVDPRENIVIQCEAKGKPPPRLVAFYFAFVGLTA